MGNRSYLWGVLVLIVACAAVLGAVKAHAPMPAPAAHTLPSTQVQTTSSPVATPATHSAPVQTKTQTAATPTVSTPATATLVVDGTRYALHAPAGTSLKDAMDTLEGEGGFSYTYSDYAGLGAFVTEINGRAGTDQYWILYVNGKQSGTGISSTHIRSGDVIEWKLEKSY